MSLKSAQFLLGFLLVSSVNLTTWGDVTYGGGNASQPGAGNSGSATSGVTSGIPVSSSTITLNAVIQDTVAIAIFDEAGSPSDSVNFAGVSPVASIFSVNANPQNVFLSNTPTSDLIVNGAIFANVSGNVEVTVTKSTPGGNNRTIRLFNGPDRVNCRFNGSIGGSNFRFNNTLSPSFDGNGVALISLVGDIRESSHTQSDDPGDYTGIMTITITAP
ncbi:MAG: hypothetical protein QNJ31_04200 [Candidatus Caenarcaniphilales bacterium]|nr:hypothetical protein [Candidatus Caenarcaniphilales bacterium]